MTATQDLFDITDPDWYANGHPHAVYDRLRREAPVWRNPEGGPDTPWILTRYDDIRAVSVNRDNFTSSRGFRIHTPNRAAMAPEIGQVLSRFMLAMDEPEHGEFRRLVSSSFMPAALARFEPAISRSVDELFASLAGRNEVEFVTEVGAAVPIRTVCTVLGVPREDEWRVFEFTNAVFGTDDPEFAPSLEVANERYLEIFDYGWSLLQKRREDPRDDLISCIANARLENGAPLGKTEQISFFSNMIAAGNETTRSSLSGAVWALARHKDQRQALLDDPALIANGVLELLRWFSPVFQMARTTLADIDVGGVRIREGERVAMLYGAANHDPEVFADPHVLDLRRANANRHLTFGYGIHHCLGGRLAVMQLSLLLGGLLKAFPNYEVTSEPAYIRSNFVGAMKLLDVRLQG